MLIKFNAKKSKNRYVAPTESATAVTSTDGRSMEVGSTTAASTATEATAAAEVESTALELTTGAEQTTAVWNATTFDFLVTSANIPNINDSFTTIQDTTIINEVLDITEDVTTSTTTALPTVLGISKKFVPTVKQIIL